MKNLFSIKILFAILLGALVFESCSRIPISKRRQFHLLPESQLISMANTEYNAFLKTHKVISGTADADMVSRVGKRLTDAASAYLKKTNHTKRIEGFRWEYKLVEDKLVNAWCMPGGKIVVYSGMMPISQTENGLAVVMGHEIAHAIARHGNERMSQQLGIQLGGVAMSVAMSQKTQQTQQVFSQVYGIGSAVGLALPFSRMHELEADKLGLMFMSWAGYDPNEAPKFWTRMKKASNGSAPPEMLSTHPSDDKRISEINAYLPQVLKFYRPM